MNYDVFRFMTLRPPEAIDAGIVSVNTTNPESAFQNKLHAVQGSLEDLVAESQRYTADPNEYIAHVNQVTTPVLEFEKRVNEKIGSKDTIAIKTLNGIIELVFKKGAVELIQDQGYLIDRRRVIDSLIAQIIIGDATGRHTQELTHLLRLFALIEIAATQTTDVNREISLSQVLSTTILLPTGIFPLPAKKKKPVVMAQESTEPSEEELLEQWLALLRGAIDELRALDLDDFLPPPAPKVQPQEKKPASAEEPPKEEPPPVQGGLPGENPIGVGFWVMTTEAIARLTETTKQVFAKLKINPAKTPVPTIVNLLENEVIRVGARLFELLKDEQQQVIKVGSTIITLPGTSGGLSSGASLGPGSGGAFHPIGITDLMVVRQQIQRYDAGEVAHIENVLQGESKERTHRRAKRTEESILIETERTTDTERDLQTTERFELQKEAQETVKTDHELDISLTVKYGGFVDVTASTQYALKQSQEKSTKASAQYARDVTERAVSKIQERVREERKITIIEEFEETNRHGINNANGTGHVTGIYRWVDKKYKAQIFNYGKRLMFEFVIPEPAAFVIAAPSLLAAEGKKLEKPIPFTLAASAITESNYLGHAARYNATDIKPPPTPFLTIAAAKAKQSEKKEMDLVETFEIDIPNGWEAISCYVLSTFTYWPDDKPPALDIAIEHQYRSMGLSDYVNWVFNLNQTTGRLPVGILGFRIASYAVTFSLLCQRTKQAYRAWQIETHAAIVQAYLNKLSEYEEKLAAAAIGQGIEISGQNPGLNRELEKTELKKGSLILLTEKTSPRFDANGSVGEMGEFLYPEIDFEEANKEGPYIQFFEQAFEWNQMMYSFYPYFWARKARWPFLQQLQDTDPFYARFLQAGAARVLVPVRPGYEESIFYYLDTGLTWKGSGSPPVSSPLYLPIVQEIKEQQGALAFEGIGQVTVKHESDEVTGTDTRFMPDDVDREIVIDGKPYRIAEVRSAISIRLTKEYVGSSRTRIPYALGAKFVGEPWEVTVPTSLVFLQQGANLPDFT